MAPIVTGSGESSGDGLNQKSVSSETTSLPLRSAETETEGQLKGDSRLNEKKQAVTDRLRKREDERLSILHQRRAEKEVSSKEGETNDSFRQKFLAIKNEIDDGLKNSSEVEESERQAHFDKLVVLVQSMQKILTDSTQFLSPYSIESAQDTIGQLKGTIEQRRASVAPKKKFAFKGGKKKTACEVADKQVSSASDKCPEGSSSSAKSLSAYDTVDSMWCGFKDQTNKTLSLSAAELLGKRVNLSNLTGCTIRLHGATQAITADNLSDCTVSCGPVSGSVFVDKCARCQVSVACQQLRVHGTSDTTFYLHVTSRAIIEDCHGVQTAPFSAVYQGLDEQFTEAGLDRARNSWNDLDDFDWLASDVASPNWSVLDISKRHNWN